MRFRYSLYLFAFCWIVSLSSCKTTSVVPIRVYDPPEVKFPDSTYHITLVNRLYFPIAKESYNKRKKNRIDSLVINNIAQNKLFEGIKDALYSFELIDTVTIVQKSRELKDSLNFDIELKPLSWDTIGAISDRNSSNVVISLDGLIIKSLYSSEPAISFGTDINLLFSKICKLKIYLSALFRMYDPEKKHLMEKYCYSDTIFWESTGMTTLTALRNLPSKKDAISEAAYWSGFYYGERLIPQWQEVDRFYFISGHPYLREAAILANEEKWLDAAKIWKALAYRPDNKIASRAALNMALVSEMYDNLDAALNWAKKSYSLDKKESVEQYIKVLQERIRLYKKHVWTKEEVKND